jgi:hypothetical protein
MRTSASAMRERAKGGEGVGVRSEKEHRGYFWLSVLSSQCSVPLVRRERGEAA